MVTRNVHWCGGFKAGRDHIAVQRDAITGCDGRVEMRHRGTGDDTKAARRPGADGHAG